MAFHMHKIIIFIVCTRLFLFYYNREQPWHGFFVLLLFSDYTYKDFYIQIVFLCIIYYPLVAYPLILYFIFKISRLIFIRL